MRAVLRRRDSEAPPDPLGVEPQKLRAVAPHHLAHLIGRGALEQACELQRIREALRMGVVGSEEHAVGAEVTP